MNRSGSKKFPETNWGLVRKASNEDEGERTSALSELYIAYWPPVYALIRSLGNPPHDAEDLTLGFFAEFLRRKDFEKTDSERGRLRSYLLSAVKHYLAGEHRKATRQKRGGGVTIISMDAAQMENYRILPEPSDDLTPDRIFDRHWAATLLDRVFKSLESSDEQQDKDHLFAALKPSIMPGATCLISMVIAKELGMSDGAVRSSIHRLRKLYGKRLKEVVAKTLPEGADVDEEVQEVTGMFS